MSVAHPRHVPSLQDHAAKSLIAMRLAQRIKLCVVKEALQLAQGSTFHVLQSTALNLRLRVIRQFRIETKGVISKLSNELTHLIRNRKSHQRCLLQEFEQSADVRGTLYQKLLGSLDVVGFLFRQVEFARTGADQVQRERAFAQELISPSFLPR